MQFDLMVAGSHPFVPENNRQGLTVNCQSTPHPQKCYKQ